MVKQINKFCMCEPTNIARGAKAFEISLFIKRESWWVTAASRPITQLFVGQFG